MDECHDYYTEWKKPHTHKQYIQSNFIDIKLSKMCMNLSWQKAGQQLLRCGSQGAMGGRNSKGEWRNPLEGDGDSRLIYWWFQGGIPISKLIKWYTLNTLYVVYNIHMYLYIVYNIHISYVNYSSLRLPKKRPINYMSVCCIHPSFILVYGFDWYDNEQRCRPRGLWVQRLCFDQVT